MSYGRPEPPSRVLGVQAPEVLDVRNLGFWTAGATGGTSNEFAGRPATQPGRPTDLLDVRQTHWTSHNLAGRPAA